jgi:hypothetical protein
LRASPSASTSTHPQGLLGEITVNRQHPSHIIFECGLFCPSKCTVHNLRVRALLSLESLLRASSALVLFECGRSCPSNRSFRPAAPWYYSSAGALVPRIAPSGQQRLGIIRARASVPRIILFGPAAPLRYSSAGFGPLNYSLQASSASALFERGLRSLELFSLGQQRLHIL